MQSFLSLVDIILELYVWLLVIWVVISWLVGFDVINKRNRFVYLVSDFLYRITEPALRPIRRVVPNLDDSVCPRVRQRLQQDRVDQSENRHRGADSHAQRECRNRTESRASDQCPRR